MTRHAVETHTAKASVFIVHALEAHEAKAES